MKRTSAGLVVIAMIAAGAAAPARAQPKKPQPGKPEPARPEPGKGGGKGGGKGEPSQLLGEGELVGLLNVTTEGVSREAKQGFIANVEDGLKLADFRVVQNKTLLEVLASSPYVDGCLFGPCLRHVYNRTKVRLVVVARISGVGSAYSLIVSLLDTQSGAVVSQVAETCPVCTVDEALLQASNVVIDAVTKVNREGVPAPKVEPAGPPPGPPPDNPAKNVGIVTSVLMLGTGVAAGISGGVLISRGNDKAGAAVLGAGGALTLSGISFLVITASW